MIKEVYHNINVRQQNLLFIEFNSDIVKIMNDWH